MLGHKKSANEYIISGAIVFDGNEMVYNKDIHIVDNKIASLCQMGEKSHIPRYDATGLIASYGFIDLQINGCGGVLLNDSISKETLDAMNATNLKYGCTSFLPTLITTSEDNMKKALDVVYNYHVYNPYAVLGIHLEGPYISKIKKGAHNPNYIKSISHNMVDIISSYANKMIVKITLAPEENDPLLVKKLVQNGVLVSIGHTNASYDECMIAINMGASLSTHLFNAMSQFTGRDPSVVGAILNSDIYAGIIADGYHVDFRSIELVKKIKGSKLYLVSDAVTPMGTNMDKFMLADQMVYVKDGKCINEEGVLAGANIDMMSSIKNCIYSANISMAEALKMATLYPAQAINKSLALGRIMPDYIANIAIFDSNSYNCKIVIQNGGLYFV